MTHDEILAMTPAELREAIAKLVEPTITCTMFDVPDWTKNISNAWELVEDIRAHGDEITINSDRRGDNTDIFTVSVRSLHYGEKVTGWIFVDIEAPTAPLAISRAWLLWKQEK